MIAFWITPCPPFPYKYTVPLNVYLSEAKVRLDPVAHSVGHDGDVDGFGQPALPSAGYGSFPCGPWWRCFKIIIYEGGQVKSLAGFA